ncbi:hypothetical protein SARC_12380 [Sphaeroforma arctica JP610]|uniref:Protein kinase domain-containing protein n=1 Tax=Sphaeroforma arctica JP610 TaxID=667725 RepID=A0A0L0FF64_9EUKA|nr:hypothetical protein SARC_12380 [Sphaeroforma arctica JP610]KNC75086.1 hypothetical protein SARC_12380 [Sphaeroforma arctica JP610]|eukprot:XP_014148988.1 hypothetical protein SARC_12380 [Sphaeroforma arctica JP610]
MLLYRPPRAKVSDLGLAREVDEHSQYTKTSQNVQLPVRWMAPENIMEFKANQATDVWAFGITTWEIISNGMMPFHTLTNKEVIVLLTNPNTIISTYLIKQDHWTDEIYKTVLDCTAFEPDDRPSFDMLRNDFMRMVNNLGPLTVDEKNHLMTYNGNIKCKFTWMMNDDDVNALVRANTKKITGQSPDSHRVYTELQKPMSGVSQNLDSSTNLFDSGTSRDTVSCRGCLDEVVPSGGPLDSYMDRILKSKTKK